MDDDEPPFFAEGGEGNFGEMPEISGYFEAEVERELRVRLQGCGSMVAKSGFLLWLFIPADETEAD